MLLVLFDPLYSLVHVLELNSQGYVIRVIRFALCYVIRILVSDWKLHGPPTGQTINCADNLY